MLRLDEKTESLVRNLPDAAGARAFYERLAAEHPRAAQKLARQEGLLSDALALAAWSPLLATTLAQHPDYLNWLARERTDRHVRTTEELSESLARFALTHSQIEAQVLLARFRRRELLRIYLHDIRRTATIVETTEELSNLADTILAYALNLARQELDNRYGAPLCTDARGRTTSASFAVVALGKLGSRELNYASDIDLLFLYSDDGQTAGTGEGGAGGTTSNREYFNRLAEKIARLVGQPTGEGAAYRVDLRLRPHGRVGALSCSLQEAVRYYRQSAQAWELQTLIRSRAAAGTPALYTRFAASLRERIYTHAATVEAALSNVRLAKQKIDRQHGENARGYNVKLGQGGIREIEFIAQALQLAHGASDSWLHAPHTLISLGRLADRGRITERERSELSDAYTFLRTLEHRLQMEHGLQTHTLPEDEARRTLIVRRMNFTGHDALVAFNHTLQLHTTHVRAAYARIFGERNDSKSPAIEVKQVAIEVRQAAINEKKEATGESLDPPTETIASAPRAQTTPHASRVRPNSSAPLPQPDLEMQANPDLETQTKPDAGGAITTTPAGTNVTLADARATAARANATLTTATLAAATVFAPRLVADVASNADEAGKVGASSGGDVKQTMRPPRRVTVESVARLLQDAARASLNAQRALTYVARIAASLDKSEIEVTLTAESLRALVQLCGASEFFGEMLASNPALIPALLTDAATVAARDYRALLRAEIDREKTFREDLSALRRAWSQLLVETGARDVAGDISHAASNELQTALAAASINAAYFIARREMARRHGQLVAGPRLSVFGLGRLGSGGMDYGSDLDLIIIYDPQVPSPVAGATQEEAYTRLTELMVAALSSLTRAGYLYRVDLRLRPDGKNGALVRSSDSFIEYLRTRADVWEWLAYVKLRAVGGDLELGRLVERRARAAIHERARGIDAEDLRRETRRVRERLEQERGVRPTTAAAAAATRDIDIKFGAGGMLDVYFATRFLQLRHDVQDVGLDRSTRTTLARLFAAGALDADTHRALADGYACLRTLDHHLRLIAGRSSRLPASPDHTVLRDLARAAGYTSSAALTDDLTSRMNAIRAAYDQITSVAG